MKTRIVPIGNSQGVRIPKPLLEQTVLRGEVESEVDEDRLVIKAIRATRSGWAEAFRAMAGTGDDVLLDAEAAFTTSWGDEEWQWP